VHHFNAEAGAMPPFKKKVNDREEDMLLCSSSK
jgi:hypothetical protein